MAAAYLLHLVQNHPSIDGNKRVGLEAAILFLELNRVTIEAPDDALADLVLNTAQGAGDKAAIATFLRAHVA